MEKNNNDGIYFMKIDDIYGYDFKIGEFPSFFVKKARKNHFTYKKIDILDKLRYKKIILVEKQLKIFKKNIFYYEDILSGVRFSLLNELYNYKHLEEFSLLLLFQDLTSLRWCSSKKSPNDININLYDYFDSKELFSDREIELFMECLEPYLKLYEELGFKRETLVNSKPFGKKLVRTFFDNNK